MQLRSIIEKELPEYKDIFVINKDDEQDLIIQNTHVGYRGGLNLIEDIYHNLFSGNQINSSTYNDSVVV